MTITFPEQFNMAAYFLDDRIKEGRGNKVAVYYEDQQYTYAEVQKMANRVGNALCSLGIRMEDRVLIALPDSIEFVATWFGHAKVGTVIRPPIESDALRKQDRLIRGAIGRLRSNALLGGVKN